MWVPTYILQPIYLLVKLPLFRTTKYTNAQLEQPVKRVTAVEMITKSNLRTFVKYLTKKKQIYIYIFSFINLHL